ncbi:kinase-like protein, partial [Didymella exigua CBS 183.55]
MRAGALTGLQPDHRRLEQGKLFLEDVKALGRGSSAMVYSVRHRVSKKEFACKRIERGPARFQHDNLRDFLREVRILQRLHHQHIVRLIASYTDEATFSLILLPVANDTLESLLRQITPSANEQGESILRHAFGCLLSTLKYLQDHAIRHKDIKPLNILLSDQGSIYLCDFGISLDYSETKEATTEGRVLGFTPGYCAPEVGSGEARNALSEVWSMGRVFFDMIV